MGCSGGFREVGSSTTGVVIVLSAILAVGGRHRDAWLVDPAAVGVDTAIIAPPSLAPSLQLSSADASQPGNSMYKIFTSYYLCFDLPGTQLLL